MCANIERQPFSVYLNKHFFLSIYLSISTTAPQIAHLKLPLAFNLVIAYMLMLAKIHLYVVNLPSNVLFLSQLL